MARGKLQKASGEQPKERALCERGKWESGESGESEQLVGRTV